MKILLAIAGALIVLYALRDIFHTVFHPHAYGSIGEFVGGFVWRITRRIANKNHSILSLAGPLSIVLVAGCWALLNIIGFALIFRTLMPESFVVPQEIGGPKTGLSFLDAVNVSYLTLVTMSGGQFTPDSKWLRLLMPLEATIGFVLITASISWVLSTFPVVKRRRTLANELAELHATSRSKSLELFSLDAKFVATLLYSLAGQLKVARADLTQFPTTYFFHSHDIHDDLPLYLPYLRELAGKALGSNDDTVRAMGHMLQQSIEGYLTVIAPYVRCKPDSPKQEILDRYTHDHMVADEVRKMYMQ